MANDEAPAEAVDGAPWNPESVLGTPYELGFRLLAVSMQLLEGFSLAAPAPNPIGDDNRLQRRPSNGHNLSVTAAQSPDPSKSAILPNSTRPSFSLASSTSAGAKAARFIVTLGATESWPRLRFAFRSQMWLPGHLTLLEQVPLVLIMSLILPRLRRIMEKSYFQLDRETSRLPNRIFLGPSTTLTTGTLSMGNSLQAHPPDGKVRGSMEKNPHTIGLNRGKKPNVKPDAAHTHLAVSHLMTTRVFIDLAPQTPLMVADIPDRPRPPFHQPNQPRHVHQSHPKAIFMNRGEERS
ncbi:hypothetical protein TgHK011_008651 [Trichoderma gracile]|nr:hypothetical protein TgHK011_008651 [Trichoderma gracile]